MIATFHVNGPYKVPLKISERKSTKSVDEHALKEFWAENSIVDGIGCYALCHRAGRGQKPFYVGKTSNSFSKEALNVRNIKTINQELADRYKGSIVLYLIRLEVRKKPNKKAIASLERTLVRIAHQKNPKLKNEKLKEILFWTVRGALNVDQGKPSNAARQLVDALGIPRK
jgi:hypothetical protein